MYVFVWSVSVSVSVCAWSPCLRMFLPALAKCQFAYLNMPSPPAPFFDPLPARKNTQTDEEKGEAKPKYILEQVQVAGKEKDGKTDRKKWDAEAKQFLYEMKPCLTEKGEPIIWRSLTSHLEALQEQLEELKMEASGYEAIAQMHQDELDIFLEKQRLADKCSECSSKPAKKASKPPPGVKGKKEDGKGDAADAEPSPEVSGCGHPVVWTLCEYAGQKVMLSETYKKIFDSAEGPLEEGVLGEICAVDKVGALKPFKVRCEVDKCLFASSCGNERCEEREHRLIEWWYSGSALVLADPSDSLSEKAAKDGEAEAGGEKTGDEDAKGDVKSGEASGSGEKDEAEKGAGGGNRRKGMGMETPGRTLGGASRSRRRRKLKQSSRSRTR